MYDHELKLARAQYHLNDLQKKARGWIDAVNETVEEGPDPEHPGDYSAWVTSDDPPREPFSLLVADVLQNLRTTLDQLAFRLAASFTLPLPHDIAEDSQFPIFGDADKSGKLGTGSARFHSSSKTGVPNKGSGLFQIRGIDPAAQKVIETLQPYHRGKGFEDHPLWRLNALNRVEKHRALHVAVATLEGIVVPPNAAGFFLGIGGIIHSFGKRVVKGRTQIMRFEAAEPIPEDQMSLGITPSLHIVFDPSTRLVGGQNVLVTLGRMHDYIVSDVLPPLVGFLK